MIVKRVSWNSLRPVTCRLKWFMPLFTTILRSQEVGQLSNQTAGDEEGERSRTWQAITALWPSWTMFSLLMGWPGVISEMASISLNQEASQKELEGVRKIEWWRTSPRCFGSRKSAAKNMKNSSTSPGPMLKKAKNKRTSIYNCFIFIYVFREFSKHTVVLYLFSLWNTKDSRMCKRKIIEILNRGQIWRWEISYLVWQHL
jgi:hypothetical protein